MITGVALNGEGKPSIPNTLGKNIKDGLEQALDGKRSEYAKTMGRIGAARQINAGAFPEIERLIRDRNS